jgi:hypothetical protein
MDMREAIDLCEMAYNRPKAESIITGLEEPINQHLLKLMTVAADDKTRDHWIKELIGWFTKIERIRLKPSNKPAEPEFYFRILFDEPFGGAELMNINVMLRDLRRVYSMRDNIEPDQIVVRLHAFHQDFAQRASSGTNVIDPSYEENTRSILERL